MGRAGKLVSRVWGIEQSVVDDTPKLTYVIGDDLMIENHGGIDSITSEEVSFGSGIKVSGGELAVVWIEKDFAVIRGTVDRIDLIRNSYPEKKKGKF